MSVLTPTMLAEKLDSDPRTVRKFLRSITPREEQPGKGSRWAIEAKRVATLRKQFKKWVADEAVKAAARAEAAAQAATEAVDETETD